jgi:hypothetical protein
VRVDCANGSPAACALVAASLALFVVSENGVADLSDPMLKGQNC